MNHLRYAVLVLSLWSFSLGHLCWPQGLAASHTPDVFADQMAGAALHGNGIGRVVIESLHTGHVTDGVKGAVDMAALAILRDDEVTLVRSQFALESFVEGMWPAGHEVQQEKAYGAEQPPRMHGIPHGPMVGRVRQRSGRRDLNPRPSAWEADTLPLSYSRSSY